MRLTSVMSTEQFEQFILEQRRIAYHLECALEKGFKDAVTAIHALDEDIEKGFRDAVEAIESLRTAPRPGPAVKAEFQLGTPVPQ